MNHCARYVTGGQDCENQMRKGFCPMKEGKGCIGKTNAIGASIQKAEDMLARITGEHQQQGQTTKAPRQME